jgi:hypothetical protein
MMIRPDNQYDAVVLVAGSVLAAGGSLVTDPLDNAGYDGNALLSVVVGQGTGTLNLTVQHGTTTGSYSAAGTDVLFDPNTGEPADGVDSVIASGSLLIGVNLEKAYRYIRVSANTANGNQPLTVVAIAPKKYANFS